MSTKWKAQATAEVAAAMETFAPRRSSYVIALQSSLSGSAFLASQVQFGFAVRAFSRPLALLLARCDAVEDRAVLAENLWEEHGEGDIERSHAATFDLFLKRLAEGVGGEAAQSNGSEGAAARAFNHTVTTWASDLSPSEAASSLGMVERLFADYSNEIAKGVVARGFLAADALAHYALHEERDLDHADALFSIATGLDRDGFAASIRQGAETFTQFYDALLAEAVGASPPSTGPTTRTKS